MNNIPLSTVPYQSFSIRLEQDLYDIIISETDGLMSISIMRNSTPIVLGQRIEPSYPLIPYLYLFEGKGNFIMLTEDNMYPYYTQFGVNQFLLYVTSLEMQTALASIQNGSSRP